MKWLFALLLLLGLAAIGLFILVRTTGPQHTLSNTFTPLASCPNKPNCVCSDQVSYAEQKIEPLNIKGDIETSMTELKKIIENTQGATVIREESGYLYAQFKTPLIGYIDDFELKVSDDQSVIHIRSSSRLGHKDFNVNINRVNLIRQTYQKNQPHSPIK